MAVIFKTNNPALLQRLIYQAVDNGTLQTWSRRGQTLELTHTLGGQWGNLAWLTPVDIVANSTELKFKIHFPANADLDRIRAIYAVYQGRFIEIITTHLYNNFEFGASTSKPKDYDVMTPAQRIRLNT